MTSFIKALVALCCIFFVSSVAAGGYPSANVEPDGEWNTMGNKPYVGMPRDGCVQIGYDSATCDKYMTLRATGLQTGQCRYMDVPNDGSIILHKLLFASGEVQRNVRVNLKEYPTLRSLVCQLDGDALIAFDGCSNLGVVEGWAFNAAPVRSVGARPHQEPSEVCELSNHRHQITSVLEARAVENSCAQRLINISEGGDGIDGERLSRTCGPELNRDYQPGVLSHSFEFVFIPYGSEFEYPIFQGAVQHNELTASPGYEDMVIHNTGPTGEDDVFRIPDFIEVDGEIISLETGRFETRFADYGKLSSPHPKEGSIKHLSERGERMSRGCALGRATAIERLEPVESIEQADQPELSGQTEPVEPTERSESPPVKSIDLIST